MNDLGIDKDKLLYRLLAFGFLPNKLDDILESKSFCDFVMKEAKDLESILSGKFFFNTVKYRVSKHNTDSRLFEIPHPLIYLKQAFFIIKNRDSIENVLLEKNENYKKISLIRPYETDSNRLFSLHSYTNSVAEDSVEYDIMLGKRYLVTTDISKFFHSIYSHSIERAIIGKRAAKESLMQKHSSKTWATQFDILVRSQTDAETSGIPIGPDISNLVGEIILSQIDKTLSLKYEYVRYIDDYKCYVQTKEEGERFIKDLGMLLWEYKLTINSSKTKIIGVADMIDGDWVVSLRNVDISRKEKYNYKQFIDMLGLGLQQSKKIGDSRPFKYILKKLKDVLLLKYIDFKNILTYIFTMLYVHPYVISDIGDYLDVINRSDYTSMQKNKLNQMTLKVLIDIAKENASYGRSDIVVYVLFYLKKYQLKSFGNKKMFLLLQEAVLQMNDCLPTLMLFDLRCDWDYDVGPFFSLLKGIDERERWMYIYELYRYDAEKVINVLGNMQYKDFYEKMSINSVTFIKSNAVIEDEDEIVPWGRY